MRVRRAQDLDCAVLRTLEAFACFVHLLPLEVSTPQVVQGGQCLGVTVAPPLSAHRVVLAQQRHGFRESILVVQEGSQAAQCQHRWQVSAYPLSGGRQLVPPLLQHIPIELERSLDVPLLLVCCGEVGGGCERVWVRVAQLGSQSREGIHKQPLRLCQVAAFDCSLGKCELGRR